MTLPDWERNSWLTRQASRPQEIGDLPAEKLGLDPADLRLKNIPAASQGREGSPHDLDGTARVHRARRR